VIEVAARHADAICLAVGADPYHVAAKLAHARAAASAAGRDPAAVRYGMFVTAVIHDDVRVARDAVRGAAATFARFSAFAGSRIDELPPPLAAAARWLRANYDMGRHTRADAPHAAGLPDAFVDWFAIAGPADEATARFQRLAALGLDFCWVAPGSTGMPRDVAVASVLRLGRDVAPVVRRPLSAS
jgi:5,10-methylenetetrahydromethanopterin reductase